MKRPTLIFVILILIGAAWLSFRACRPDVVHEPIISEEPIAVSTAPVEAVPVIPETAKEKPVKPKTSPAKAAAPAMAPPPVKIHKELIPKNIEIVRVYYVRSITGPSSEIEFDINGTGFTEEFEKMITAESGQPTVAVKNLKLITPNQIHGTLVVGDNAPTVVSFPKVLIKGKVVFQAPDPFAIIRPGEVLNLVFTDMGESGRNGRFRVFTNLTEEMFMKFKVEASTPAIFIGEYTPFFPFIVDGSIIIGPAAGGDYGMRVLLDEKVLWNRDGIIRVVKPNVGQSGLMQKILVADGFLRPGDEARFLIQGSGFQPGDVNLLRAVVPSLDKAVSSFTFLATGRMELVMRIPKQLERKAYSLNIFQGDELLFESKDIFKIVDINWTRDLNLSPDIGPGEAGQLLIRGRDLSKDFISSLRIEVDEPELKIGKFEWKSPEEASAPISAGASIKPGDYLIKLTSNKGPVTPEFGSIIKISPPKK